MDFVSFRSLHRMIQRKVIPYPFSKQAMFKHNMYVESFEELQFV